jgi:hypothetical protein
MSKLKQNIEDTLIELVDDYYKVDVKNTITNGRNISNKDIFSIYISTPNRKEKELDLIEEYLHQCYDLMEIENYEIFDVTLTTDYYSLKVKKLDKSKGKVLETLNIENWEELWDSIDFCLFSSSDDPELYTSIKLDFKKL